MFPKAIELAGVSSKPAKKMDFHFNVFASLFMLVDYTHNPV